MSHHSPNFDPEMEEIQKKVRKLVQEGKAPYKVGPTGWFSDGKLTKSDEGEIKFAVFVKDSKVIIDFQSPVHWLGMTADQALQLADLLTTKSKLILEQEKEK